MSKPFKTDNPELEALFERYRNAPNSHVFAPLADGCRKAGLLEEAIEICEKGVSSNPGYASGYVVRGKCYYDLGNADQAEASFEKVLELDGNNLVALKYMGLILAERGQAHEARAHFEHILDLDPDDKEIAAKLASLGDTDASIDVTLARELNDVLGPDPVVDEHRDRGRDGVDARPVDAEPVELRDVEDETFVGAQITLGDGESTPDVLATMTLADIYAVQGYPKKAIKIYTELLDSQPGHRGITEKLRGLGVDTAATVEPVEPVKVVEPAEPVESVEPVEPVKVVEPAEPVEPVESVDSVSEAVAHATESAQTVDEPVATADESGDDTGDEDKPVLESAAVSAEADETPPGDNRNAAHFKRWLDNFSR